ncbi:MAG: cytochrome C [Flavobacteriia bacterium]|nr:cytochrome C [Flavobacteriia bacterium]
MKIILRIIGVLAVIVIALVVFIQLTYDVDFTEEYPVNEDLSVEITPERVAHGEYLAYGPAHCASCHIPMEDLQAIDNGEKRPLIGGFELTLPPATLRAPNITPDVETGIGGLSDGELYRMMRYNVMHDGTTTIELMPFATMSDEDIYSIIAFLRSQEPVHNVVEPTEWTMMGKAIKRFALKPLDDGLDEHPEVEKAVTVEYGEYLAESVANCRGCHTERDLKSGKYIGPFYAGGFNFEPSPETQGWSFVSPNLTPDESGVMHGWNESAFYARMKAGRSHMTSPMPWGTFSRMDSTDMSALWLFFSNLEPVENDIEQIAFEPEE